jgi:hypothetical protein
MDILSRIDKLLSITEEGEGSSGVTAGGDTPSDDVSDGTSSKNIAIHKKRMGDKDFTSVNRTDCGCNKKKCNCKKKKKVSEADAIKGGKADKLSLEDILKKHTTAGWKGTLVDLKKQEKVGIKVELEHTDDHTLAAEIVRDHLEELPTYYDHLDKMEVDAKKELNLKEDEGGDLTDDDKTKLRAFVRELKLPAKDSAFHAFTEKIGVDTHKAEAYIYTLAKEHLQKHLKD